MRSKQAPVDGRRKFLTKVGGLAAVVAGLPFAGGTPLCAFDHGRDDGHGGHQDDDHDGDDALEERAREAYRLRVEAARFQRHQLQPPQRANGDERRYPDFIGNFSKTLPHDALGIVDPAAYNALRRAMKTADPDDFDAIPMGGVAKLSNPQSAFAFQTDGADSHHLGVRVPPALASAEEAGEMAEVYWLALTRDVPFANYDVDANIAAAAADLSMFSDFRGPKISGHVTPATIFRGTTPGDLAGPYISQFLVRAVPFGPYSVPPEGSPTHPAYPAGHAVFAGAGATMLKAFFDETFVIPLPVVPSSDGSTLNPYPGTLTVGNELNKLASNISLGRDATGVHWRTDGFEGMRLGEAAAIALLQDVRHTYNERFAGFTFTKFDGTTIVI